MKRVLSYIIMLGLFSSGMVVGQTEKTSPLQKGRIWGYIFGDMIYKAAGDTLVWGKTQYAGIEKHALGADLRRLYLGYDYDINEDFSVKVLFEGSAGVTMPSGKFGLSIKTGYLEWKNVLPFIPNSSFKVGLIPTPIFSFPEKTWGYRSIEKEALDLRGLGRSVDQGVSLSGSFDKNNRSGFTFLVGNGTGNKPGVDKHLELSGSLFKKLANDHISIEVMGDYLRKDERTQRAVTRGFFSVQQPGWTFGTEVSSVFNTETVSGELKDVNSLLLSVFFSNNLSFLGDNWRSFVRYDFYDPDLDYHAEAIYESPSQHYNEHAIWVGLHYKLEQKINIMPNVVINSYTKKNENLIDRTSTVVPRITVYFLFGDR